MAKKSRVNYNNYRLNTKCAVTYITLSETSLMQGLKYLRHHALENLYCKSFRNLSLITVTY